MSAEGTLYERLRAAGVITDGTYGPIIDPEKVLAAIRAAGATDATGDETGWRTGASWEDNAAFSQALSDYNDVEHVDAAEREFWTSRYDAIIAGAPGTGDEIDVERLRVWADAFYGPIEDYGDGNVGMTQLDHGHEEYEARIEVVRILRERTPVPARIDMDGEGAPDGKEAG